MKKIIIHVGAGKTGTTALQVFFKENEKHFLNQGFAFPVTGRAGRKDAIAHHKLCDWGPYNDGASLQRWAEIASQHSESTLIVSSEVFHSKISEPDGRAFFQELRRACNGRQILVVMYIRRQSHWLQSAYAQWVKSELNSRSITELVSHYKKHLADQAIRFGEVFGKENVVIRPYEKSQFSGGSIFQDFAEVIDLKWSEELLNIPKRNENPRMTADALELKRRMNSFASSASDLRFVEKCLLDYSHIASKGGTKEAFSTHSIMPRALIEKIESESAPLYRILAQEFLGREDGRLFYEHIEAPESEERPKSLDQLDDMPDSVIFLLVEMVKRLS